MKLVNCVIIGTGFGREKINSIGETTFFFDQFERACNVQVLRMLSLYAKCLLFVFDFDQNANMSTAFDKNPKLTLLLTYSMEQSPSCEAKTS
jgi:hypothetical protein